MRFCFFPSDDIVKARLDARFGAFDNSAVNAILEDVKQALNKDLNESANVCAAIAAMRSAIARLDSGSAEARVEYLRAAADLQVSKGSGLLAFTAIIAATAGIALDKVLHHPIALWLCLGSAVVALAASLMTLFVVWSSAPTSDQFSTAAKESQWLTTLLVRRAWKSNLAVVLGVLATLQQQLAAAGIATDTLSMGMSADMAAAIAAGSTMVRVGTAILGVRHCG